MKILFILFASLLLFACNQTATSETSSSDAIRIDTIPESAAVLAEQKVDPLKAVVYNSSSINTGSTTPQDLIGFAKTLQGTPYKYGSIDPAVGFDCSGFITYVFNHFKIAVPRSSVDFTNEGKEVALNDAKPGDIVLFTGTDSNIHVVGHMGIIIGKENNEFQFIHSTSGKANGVTITPLNRYYMGRFVKVIRIFKQNDIN